MKKVIALLLMVFSCAAFSMPRVSFVVDNDLASEEQGTVTVVAELNRAVDDVVLVPFEVTGSARFGRDHNLSDSTLIFQPGVKSLRFSFKIFQDDRDEREETIDIELLAPTNARLGAPFKTTITVTDESLEVPVVSFRRKEQEAGEGDEILVRARLSEVSERVVIVLFEVSGSADEGDHDLIDGQFVFTSGERVSDRFIRIKEDEEDEGEETFSITLTPPVNNARLGEQKTHKVIIQED